MKIAVVTLLVFTSLAASTFAQDIPPGRYNAEQPKSVDRVVFAPAINFWHSLSATVRALSSYLRPSQIAFTACSIRVYIFAKITDPSLPKPCPPPVR